MRGHTLRRRHGADRFAGLVQRTRRTTRRCRPLSTAVRGVTVKGIMPSPAKETVPELVFDPGIDGCSLFT